MTTNDKGFIAQQKAILRAAEKGLLVSKPLRDDSRYDLIFDDGGKLIRVQVKYSNGKASHSDGCVSVNLMKNNKKTGDKYREYGYTGNDADVILVYFPEKDIFCWFDINVVAGKKKMHVRFDPPRNGQVKGLIMADQYIW